MHAASAARPRARVKPVLANSLLRRPKTVEAVLARRAQGQKPERIALDLRLVVAEVRDIIHRRRAAGDVRALTDKQAAALLKIAQLKAEDAAAVAAGTRAPLPEPKPEPRLPRILAPRIDPAGLAGYIARIRGAADRIPIRPRMGADTEITPAANAAAGLRHLADLHEHCPTFYPSYAIACEYATLESTNRRFPRAALASEGGAGLGGGASLACLQG